MDRMDHFMDWLAKQYVTALNVIHYMRQGITAAEASLMALHDQVTLSAPLACGITSLSVATDPVCHQI